MDNPFRSTYFGMLAIIILSACRQADESAIEEGPKPITPVQVTSIKDSSLSEYVEVSATSAYLKKSFVKANINGYVKSSNVLIGEVVNKAQLLFSLITKEAQSIGNTVNKLDSGFRFSGVSSIRADQGGTIIKINHQKGDYIQDGEALATISNRNSLVFLLDLPYELNQIMQQNKNIGILLPDGQKLMGLVSGMMPSVDSLAQTQRYILKVETDNKIPEGLIAKARLTKLNHPNAQILPKSAVLSNETEEEFWVMKLINDSTAIKVGVKKGIENENMIEVLSPRFSVKDRIITTGNYGIADTAKVKIKK